MLLIDRIFRELEGGAALDPRDDVTANARTSLK